MKYYKENRYGNPLEFQEVEVERETESSIWVKGRCVRKVSEYEKYFKTVAELKQHCVARYQKYVNRLKDDLLRYEDLLAKAQSIPEN